MSKIYDSPVLTNLIPLLARVLLAPVFLLAGIGKITGWDGTAAYMASAGMPLVPLFLVGAIAVEVGGGIALLLGIKTRLTGLVMALFMVPVTLIFHSFWNLQGQEQYVQMLMFLKNIAIIGGLLMVATYGGGRWALESLPCPFRKK
jgi:putative oxidoreductase